MHRFAVGLALILLAGCASTATPQSPPSRPESNELPVEITVEHLQNRDAWRVTYALAHAQRALTLARAGRAARAAHWKVLEPESARLDADPAGPCEQIARRDGEPFTRVVVEITPFFEIPEKDYPVFIPYSDGGTLLFTGHLEVGECGAPAAPGSTRSATRFHLRARPGENVIVGGRAPNREIAGTWPSDGTYAYFGSARPVTTPHLTAVIDPGLPQWMLARMTTLLPDLFAYYAEKTRRTLDQPPVVFMSFGAADGRESRSLQGGTLRGLIQLDVRLGASYREGRDPTLLADVARLVAHEAAHLWNGQMFESAGKDHGDDWMHEGGADAFMLRALRDLGVLSARDYEAALSEALSLCAVSLRGGPLTASSRPGHTKSFYWCGSTLALWTEAAYARKRSSEDLFTFWRALFDASGATHRYDADLYFRLLAERAPDAARAMERFVRHDVADVRAALTSALESAGVTVVADDAASTPLYAEVLAVRVAEIVAEGDGCRGALADAAECAARVVAVEGHALDHAPAAAWDALALRCRQGEAASILLAGEERPRRVACPKNVPPRGTYLRVVRTTTEPTDDGAGR